MKALIFLFILFTTCDFAFSQDDRKPLLFHTGVYADVSAEFIYLRYLRSGFQMYIGKTFSIQAALKVGSRTNQKAFVPSSPEGIAINWINWHQDNLTINPTISIEEIISPKKYGLKQHPPDEHSLFYANLVVSAGQDIRIIKELKFQILGGLGLRYTDEQFIGESGDAIFEYNGNQYALYYLVPVYQRGIDGHLNLELNLIYPFSDKLSFRGGIVSDFMLGFSNIGVGNYYHVGAGILIKT